MHGAAFALKARGEAVHRDEYGRPHSAHVEQAPDAVMIGCEDGIGARLAIRRAEADIAGDRRMFADFRHRGRPGRVAVAIDHQARIGLQYRGRIQQCRQAFGDPGDADVPSDMPRAFGRGYAEVAECLRDGAPGVVGGEENVGTPGFAQHADWVWIGVGQQHHRSCCRARTVR